ncbi:MAG: hypothetical protein IPI76_13330 [Chloracidobacterium sp.]|nr:hypothetical protein [Chloracidobacterium sp.]
MFVLRNRLTLPDKSRKRASFWVVLLPFVAIAFFATTLIAQNTRAIKKKQVVKPTISGRVCKLEQDEDKGSQERCV